MFTKILKIFLAILFTVFTFEEDLKTIMKEVSVYTHMRMKPSKKIALKKACEVESKLRGYEFTMSDCLNEGADKLIKKNKIKV